VVWDPRICQISAFQTLSKREGAAYKSYLKSEYISLDSFRATANDSSFGAARVGGALETKCRPELSDESMPTDMGIAMSSERAVESMRG
jgi:hypothetical protein